MLVALVGCAVLGQAAQVPSAGPALVIPIALVVVGVGIIGTLLRLTWVVSSSATKIMLDVEQLTGSLKSLQVALVSEREERMRVRATDREEHQKMLNDQARDTKELRHAVDGLTEKVHGLELRVERVAGSDGG